MTDELTIRELARFAAGELPPPRARQVERLLDEAAAAPAALDRADRALRELVEAPPPARAVLAARRAVAEQLRPTPAREIMTLDEVAEFLRLGPDEMDEVADELPAFELAGRLRVRRARLIEWIEHRERRYAAGRAQSQVARLLSGRFGKGVA